MPKENKKRGRRAEKKRKADVENSDGENASKRARHNGKDEHEDEQIADDFIPLEGGEENGGNFERPFYGLLDDEEQEYFRKAGDLLELNEFPGLDDRDAFLETVFKEAQGKELKLANSQSCSRVLERLIQLSSVSQLKQLFQAFSGK